MSLVYAQRSGGAKVSVDRCPFCDDPIAEENKRFAPHIRYQCPDAPRTGGSR